MTCDGIREAISAALDGAEAGDPTLVEAHLRHCASCRTWRDEVHALNRLVRLAPAEPVPDLVEPILAGYLAAAATARPRRDPVQPVLRTLLGLVGLVQLVLALPSLLHGGTAPHVAHELGSWDVALGIGFLVVAWRPDRAIGLLPFVAALAGCLVLTATLDVLHARTPAIGEVPHALAFAGLSLLVVLRQPPAVPPGHAARA